MANFVQKTCAEAQIALSILVPIKKTACNNVKLRAFHPIDMQVNTRLNQLPTIAMFLDNNFCL